MLKRVLSFTSLLAILLTIGLLVPVTPVAAQCTPAVGTGADENFDCTGVVAIPLVVGSGHDTVTISGTMLNVILSTGGTLEVTIDGGTLSSITNGIQVTGNGSIILNGDVIASIIGLSITGIGDITSVGDVSGNSMGILLSGTGDINSMGDVHGGVAAIFLSGSGDVTSIGNITATTFGIEIVGNGNINAEGNITTTTFGLFITGAGNITYKGDMTGSNGIFITGAGNIDVTGSIISSAIAIQGIIGDHRVDIDGTVTAPIAVLMGFGNDTVYVHDSSSVTGAIDLGGGDDTFIIGDNSIIANTIVAGETLEVNGDTLIIGDGQVCTEDGEAVAGAQIVSGLDPNGDTVVYLGQTYTWTEFEHILSGVRVAPCVGKINDGRINAYDIGAPVALYCTVGGGTSFWDIDLDGNGAFTTAVTHDQIEAAFLAAVASGENQWIGSDNLGNTLYALSDGHTLAFFGPDLREPGKTYEFTFERTLCPV